MKTKCPNCNTSIQHSNNTLAIVCECYMKNKGVNIVTVMLLNNTKEEEIKVSTPTTVSVEYFQR